MSDAAGGGFVLSPRERIFVPLAAAAFVALAFLTDPPIFRTTDFVKHWELNQAYLRTRLLAGQLPQWTPYVGLGRPFLASADGGVLYPPVLLAVPLPIPLAAALLTFAHVTLACVAMFKLGGYMGMARPARWLAAMAFVGATHVFVNIHIGAVQYGWAACYLPLIYWLGARLQDRFTASGAAALALVLALQLLCGPPQVAWNGWLGLGAFLLGRSLSGARRSALREAAAGLAAMALALAWAFMAAAVQLLPLFELAGQSNRAHPTLAGVSQGSLPWRMWLSLFVPADTISQVPMLTAVFVGAPVVIGGLCGLAHLRDRNVRGLAVAAGLAVLVAAGNRTPAFPVLFHVVPGLSSFHLHSRAAILVVLSLVLGFGLFLTRSGPTRGSLGLLAAATLGLVLGTLWWRAHVVPAGAEATAWLLWRCAVVLASAALLAAWHARRGSRRDWSLAGVGLLVAVELGGAAAVIKRVGAIPGPFRGEGALVELLRGAGRFDRTGVPPRVFVPYGIIRDNSGNTNGYSTVAGYVPLGLDRVWTYIHETLRVPYPVGVNEFPSPEIYQHGPFAYDSMNIAAGWDPESGALRLNPAPDPRAYLAGAAETVPDWRAAVHRMRDGHDFHHVALLETPPPQALDGLGGAAAIVRFEPERIAVDVDSRGRALLVLAEPWYPGWRASVNDAPAPVLPANAWMRAVPVPAGRSRVVLEYGSRYLLAGTAMSVAGLGAMAAALLNARRRPREA